jgi:hypothetical protein
VHSLNNAHQYFSKASSFVLTCLDHQSIYRMVLPVKGGMRSTYASAFIIDLSRIMSRVCQISSVHRAQLDFALHLKLLALLPTFRRDRGQGLASSSSRQGTLPTMQEQIRSISPTHVRDEKCLLFHPRPGIGCTRPFMHALSGPLPRFVQQGCVHRSCISSSSHYTRVIRRLVLVQNVRA